MFKIHDWKIKIVNFGIKFFIYNFLYKMTILCVVYHLINIQIIKILNKTIICCIIKFRPFK